MMNVNRWRFSIHFHHFLLIDGNTSSIIINISKSAIFKIQKLIVKFNEWRSKVTKCPINYRFTVLMISTSVYYEILVIDKHFWLQNLNMICFHWKRRSSIRIDCNQTWSNGTRFSCFDTCLLDTNNELINQIKPVSWPDPRRIIRGNPRKYQIKSGLYFSVRDLKLL